MDLDELDKKEVMKIFFNEVCGKEYIDIGRMRHNPLYIQIYYSIRDESANLEGIKKERVPRNAEGMNEQPIIQIKDLNLFQEKICAFVKNFLDSRIAWSSSLITETREDDIKMAFINLFTNATWQDFQNPIELIDRYISFLGNDRIHKTQKGGTEILTKDKTVLKMITKTSKPELETPYRFVVEATDEVGRKEFPSVYYGIHRGETYIYAVQGTKDTTDLQGKYQSNSYENEIVEEIRQAVRAQGKKDDYRGAEPLAIVSLISFLQTVKKLGIKKVNIPSFLPLRYNSKEQLLGTEESDRVQLVATNKLLLQIRRIMHYHSEGIKLLSVPGETGDFLSIDIANYKPKGEIIETMCANIDESFAKLSQRDEQK